MSEIILRDICKSYENGFQAVKNFNLEIEKGELVVFVGPSGCGKSTTLRMIAGLEDISDGELWIGDKLVNYLEPKERDLAMVFQSYALYPQMNIYDNIAFSLQVRKVPKKEIDKRVHHVAELLGLENLLKQRPKNLSGGQRQGAVQQADTPQNLYAYPVNRFVAGFIGSPSMNFIKGLAMEKMGIPTFCTEQDGDIPIPDFLWKILKRQGYIGRNIELGIRPEHFLEKPAGADTRGEWKMEVTVTARELLGAEVILHFNHNGQDCCAKVSGDSLIDKGDSVTLWIDMAYISAFDMETQENITLKRGAFS